MCWGLGLGNSGTQQVIVGLPPIEFIFDHFHGDGNQDDSRKDVQDGLNDIGKSFIHAKPPTAEIPGKRGCGVCTPAAVGVLNLCPTKISPKARIGTLGYSIPNISNVTVSTTKRPASQFLSDSRGCVMNSPGIWAASWTSAIQMPPESRSPLSSRSVVDEKF